MSTNELKHVVIVGGGTAGWLTAGLLAADHRAASGEGLRVTLLESPTVSSLGVGEGTWPSLRDTLRRIGVGERDVLSRCGASFKQGTRFDGWVHGGPGDTYFHPFDPPPSEDEIDPVALWHAAPQATPFALCASAQATLCLEGRAPKQPQTPDYAAVANYAYHLDAVAFADLLREHCCETLGVRLLCDDMTDVVMDGQRRIAALRTAASGEVAGDLFIDCTGARALLLGEQFGVGLTDVSDTLFNDRALALHVPHAPGSAIASQTTATAAQAGWLWDIALQSRRGVGLVYSSDFTDETTARTDLAAYLDRTAPDSGARAEDARLISFRSGYRKTPWVGNAVAIGMSQGFVEPLEASAIVMAELSATMVSDLLPARTDGLEAAARRFNARFAHRWARIVDFLKLHYVLSARGEPYWRAHRERESWPLRLSDLLETWADRAPSREDFTQIQEIFPAASYVYILYGMGFQTRTRPLARRKDSPDRVRAHLDANARRTRQLLAGLPTNRVLLDHVANAATTRHEEPRRSS